MKTERTKKLEELLSNHFNDRNEFYVFECTLGWYGSEIVDCVMYNCNRQVYCYEIKQSVQDFHSKNKLSFFGNKNYFVMPYELYEKVKNEIPKEIGVYVAIEKLEQKEEIKIDMFGNKWTNKGFYNYGVTMDLGWFEEEYFTGEYQEMYLEILKQAKARNIIFEELADVEKKENMALIGIDANTKIPINLDEIAKQINSRLNINVNESLEKTATQLKQEYENKYLGRLL